MVVVATVCPAAESAAEHDQRMAWFREARFGMFIHWGVYSVPAGEWNGNTNYGEWFLEEVGSSRVDLQACKLEYSIVSPK